MPDKYRSGCSQSSIRWNTDFPMEEVEKVAKELKGSATLLVEQQYELSIIPRAHVSSCICSRRWPSWTSVEREAPCLANFICLSTGEQQGQEVGVGGGCGGLLG